MIMVIINFVVLGLVYVSMADSETDIFASYDKLVEVETRIINNYVDDVTPEHLQQSALKGMLSKLDPYSRYISPAEFTAMQNGESIDTFTGDVGIGLTRENSLISVMNISYGSPAYLGDIMAGDKIFEIDGEMLHDPNVFDIEKLFRGEVDTEVELSIFRPPSTVRKVKLKRAEIEPVNVPVAKIINEDIGYIRVVAFGKGASTQLREKLVKLLNEEGASAIILDLRDSGNGIISEGIQAADLFIPEGETITNLKSRLAAEDKTFESTPVASTIRRPLVVIINQGTGKAAEVAAAAIKETERGIVVGEKSFGAAVEQTMVEIEHGAALKLTTGHYYSPLGAKITGEGVEPHIIVKVSVEEQQLRRQNDGVTAGPAQEEPEHDAGDTETDANDEIRKILDENKKDGAKEEEVFVDTQLEKAVDILKVIKICEKAA
jgi:carboxyl-terminal processing protease